MSSRGTIVPLSVTREQHSCSRSGRPCRAYYAGLPGLLEPSQRSRRRCRLSVSGLSSPATYAGLPGLLEPRQRNRSLCGSSVFRAFPGPEPGPEQAPSQLRMHIRWSWALESPHPPRSLERSPLADGGIEAPIGSSIGDLPALGSPEQARVTAGFLGSWSPGT